MRWRRTRSQRCTFLGRQLSARETMIAHVWCSRDASFFVHRRYGVSWSCPFLIWSLWGVIQRDNNECAFRRTHSKCPLLCALVNIDPIRGVKDRYMLLRVDTYSFILLWFVWVRFECVLKRLDEFRRLINVGAQVEFRRVWTKMRLFNLCALIFKCMKAIDSWNKNTSDVHKRLYYFS